MNNEKLDRLLTLLAAAGVTPSDFRAMSNEIRELYPTELDDRYSQIRGSLRRIMDASNDRETSRHVSTLIRAREDVMKFARQSAEGPKDAAARLRSRLTMIDDQLVLPPFSTKEGFGRWLERVMKLLSPNAVLNAAVAEFSGSHSASTDGWRLSDS